MLGNKNIQKVSDYYLDNLESYNYPEEELEKKYQIISEAIKKESAKIISMRKIFKDKWKKQSNFLVWNFLEKKKEEEKKKKIANMRNMENNYYFKSFSKFMESENDYSVDIVDEDLWQEIINYIYYILTLFKEEIYLLSQWKIEIDEKTSFWREILNLVALSSFFIRGSKENEQQFALMLEKFQNSENENFMTLWFFLEYIYLDYKKSEKSNDNFIDIIEEQKR